MINGVKYIRSEPNMNGSTFSIKKRIPDKKLADSEIISMALEDAMQNHSGGTWIL